MRTAGERPSRHAFALLTSLIALLGFAALAAAQNADDRATAIELEKQGRTLFEKKDLAGAIAAYRGSIDLDPKSAVAHNGLGIVYAAKKDFEQAVAEFQKAIDLAPRMNQAHSNLGQALREKKEPKAAIASFRKALEIVPGDVSVQLHLGTALYEAGDFDAAIAQLRKVVEKTPKNAKAYNYLGAALMAKKDLPAAIDSFRKATEADPKFAAGSHANLGRRLIASNPIPEGRQRGTAKADRSRVRATPRGRLNAGVAFVNAKNYKDARSEFEAAVALAPKDPRGHVNLANVHYVEKRYDQAIQAIQKGI